MINVTDHQPFCLGHQCTYPGCKKVLVVDGNMKNRRDVCMARDAGYIEYDGLPGAIKTGCMNTPQKGSRHCSLHTGRACIQQASQSDDEAIVKLSAVKGDQIVESILEKKETRTTTYYKV